MKFLIAFVLFVSFYSQATSLYDLSYTSIEGKTISMSEYKEKVILIVNTASRCFFTKQYDDLEKLYLKYKDRGFVVIGFPSNDFGNQEPDTNKEIKEKCSLKYNVTFPMAQKVVVTGKDKHEIFKFLSNKREIQWNFEKFLISQKGELIDNYYSFRNPSSTKISKAIEKLLK